MVSFVAFGTLVILYHFACSYVSLLTAFLEGSWGCGKKKPSLFCDLFIFPLNST